LELENSVVVPRFSSKCVIEKFFKGEDIIFLAVLRRALGVASGTDLRLLSNTSRQVKGANCMGPPTLLI
jgi:hypothetical protein